MGNTTKFMLVGLTIGIATACGGGSTSAPTPVPQINTPPVVETVEQGAIVDGYEVFEPLLTSEALNIYAISNCGDTPGSNPSNIILLDSKTPINGDAWNHIDDSSSDTWQGLTKSAVQYDIQRQTNATDTECNQVPTYNTILVKKYGDWSQQHANGYYVKTKGTATFSNLDTVIMDIYYDSGLSTLPNTEDIAQTYQSLTNDQLAEWDDGLFQLEIQLRNNTRTYHAAINLALPAEMADKWLRIEVPVNQLRTWRSVEYTVFEADLAEFSNQVFDEIGFVAETKNKKVYRNYNQQGFDVDTTPKLFKEIAFRIKRFEVTTKD